MEDDYLVVVDKPAGLHVFPSGSGSTDSVLNRLLPGRPGLAEIGDAAAPAFVHRLDRATSGLLLAAKTDKAYRVLRRAFKGGMIHKQYLALAEGSLRGEVEVNAALGGRYRRSRRVSVQTGSRRLRGVRPARSVVQEIAQASGLTLCRVATFTGFRHQVRAHLAHLGHPLAGDGLYGATLMVAGLEKQFFLHAWSMELKHPIDGRDLLLECRLPREKLEILARIGLIDDYDRLVSKRSISASRFNR